MKPIPTSTFILIAILAIGLAGVTPRAENLLFTAWQPRLGVLGMLPMGSLAARVNPYPSLHLGFSTPYADLGGSRWQAFGEMGHAYFASASKQSSPAKPAFDVHALRFMGGLAAPLPAMPGCYARLGLGYHYLRGERIAGTGPSGYAFIEDGESEAAWHMGLSFEPTQGLASKVFAAVGFDGVATHPGVSWLGIAMLGYRW